MADLIIDPTQVQPGLNAKIRNAPALEAISAGDVVYVTTNQVGVADASDAVKADVAGIALTSAAIGEEVAYINTPSIIFGDAPMLQGQVLVLSDTPGKINTSVAVSGNYVVILGCSRSTSELALAIANLNCQVP